MIKKQKIHIDFASSKKGLASQEKIEFRKESARELQERKKNSVCNESECSFLFFSLLFF